MEHNIIMLLSFIISSTFIAMIGRSMCNHGLHYIILTIYVGGTCQLRATVRMDMMDRQQLQLQLLCDGLEECPMSKFVRCDRYEALNISQSEIMSITKPLCSLDIIIQIVWKKNAPKTSRLLS